MNDVGPLPRASGKLTALLIAVVILALTVAGTLAQNDPDSSDTASPTSIAALEQAEEPPPRGQPTLGEPAPDFTVPLLDGGTFNLAEHLRLDGRPVMLNFWASWCGPCREEMPAFDQISREKPALLILGVAINDTPEAANEFANVVNVSYPLGIDNDGSVSERYPSLGLPTTWLIGADGTLIAEYIGQVDEQTLREIVSAEFGF